MATTPLPGSGSFPGNSNAKKEAAAKEAERPKLKQIVTAPVTQQKKGILGRIGAAFTGDDAKTVGRFIMQDVLIPALKSMVSDAVSQGIDRTLYGDSRPRSRSSIGYTPYNRIGPQPISRAIDAPPWRTDVPGATTISGRARATHDFREIVIGDRMEAQLVLDTLQAMIEQYNLATVADLYDAVGITAEYTDRQWGWDDLSTARVERVRNGYLLVVPQPAPIR